ncbi:hypothetical protein IWQ60_002370 [Tieghemiomyces parasiticus]|uniref:DUF202 domain-containing protein n=1 Tax=Tieghemiomyces parasiticus TaxID=78921 RepID=A0A9W8AFB2_9FUNG|nr:hypothetical protein IWQ60_002370 [Tieghemiomyces parasiticus]
MVKLIPNFALELPNQGSVARDHLANERTFLAWFRTSTALLTVGVAVTQLFQIRTIIENDPDHESHQAAQEAAIGKGMGLAFGVLSVIVLGIGTMRYFKTQRLMTAGVFAASRGTALFCSLTGLGLFICLFAIIYSKSSGS